MSLDRVRKKIDTIDDSILRLLAERVLQVAKVNEYKKGENLSTFSAQREAQVLRRLKEINKSKLSDEDIEIIFGDIMSVCRALQSHLKIAYFGPMGTFTHMAAVKKFGKKPQYLPYDTIGDVFDAVERGHADYGVVPVENSTDGVVSHTLDMFFISQAKVCAQITVGISQSLMANCALSDIKKVYSKQIVFGQCRKWLAANLHKVQLEDCISTAVGAQLAAKENTSACIGNKILAELYDLKVLRPSIEDSSQNYTRFLVIAKEDSKPCGSDKTSALLAIKDKVGALHDVLASFKKGKVNLTKIESRPSREKPWEYRFFIDFEGHRSDKRIENVLKDLSRHCLWVKILGSYPA
jgi:chorismate mutase/prephenate dehydratase